MDPSIFCGSWRPIGKWWTRQFGVVNVQPEYAGCTVRPGDGALSEIPAVGSYRWRVCALLFFATTINYMDRQVLGILAPELEKSIGWNEVQYGYIVTAFQASYAIFLLLGGGLMDRLGTRKGYSIAVFGVEHGIHGPCVGPKRVRIWIGAFRAGCR